MDRGKEGKMANNMKKIRRDRRGSTGTMEEYIRRKREREVMEGEEKKWKNESSGIGYV